MAVEKLKNVSLMNVQRQHMDNAQEIEDAVLAVLRSGVYIGGEQVSKFEKEFAEFSQTKYAISVANGTDALIIGLKSSDVKPGDEVITVACSFFATSEAIASIGATPVFVDITNDTFCMDPSLIEEAITEKTKAILVVHYYGHCAEMDEINAIAKKYNLLVLEDCAQAAGSQYKGKPAGSLGDVGCFSFYPTKSLGADGDGGIITTDNYEIAQACIGYKLHGSGEEGLAVLEKEYRHKGEELPHNMPLGKNKYYNYLIGYNSRLDAIQAAILRVKLKYLNDYISKRQQNAKYYDNALNGTNYKIPYVAEECVHSYYLYVLQHTDTERIIPSLRARGIGCDTYYPVPLHLQGAFISLGYKEGDFPVTEWLSKNTFAIPIYPELYDDEKEEVVKTLIEVENELR